MKEKFKVVFLRCENENVKILGLTAREHLEKEFANFDCTVAENENDIHIDGLTAIIPFDMPLVTAVDVEKVVVAMRQNKLSSIPFGEKNAIAKVGYGGENANFFASSEAFIKVIGAKNYNIVYNQLKERIINRLLDGGVVIPDTNTVFVDATAHIESGAQVLPFSRIEGNTVIKSGAVVEGSYLSDCEIFEESKISYSHLCASRVGARTSVGPFARLRGATVGEDCRIGDFVEVKASTLGNGTKSAHLSYIGDAEVGERTNVGCGTVFCNYDGKTKHHTSVGNDCFIGANVNLVAPIEIGDGAFIAAGTTVNKSVDDGTFTIGRLRQETKKK
ncbi:MAG: hypothetical protein MJ193_03800 [Clostridia bacterium]|nr:hypothetical protein [Clostridia bacterium]